jgi:hypothetical protein
LYFEPLVGRGGRPRAGRGRLARFVCHLDGLAEKRDRFLESGTMQRLVAGFAPPFDGRVGQTRLREVMRQHFRLGRRSVREAIAQNLGDAPMEHLPPTLEKIFVGRILNERVLEAIA